MSAGIVYILTNAAMPGYVKIGLTRRNDVGDRVKQLDNTAIPVPFECYYAATVPDCAKLERTLHFVFGEKRARKNREFFTINPDLAKAIIDLVSEAPLGVTDAEQAIDAGERREIETMRERREVRTFTSMNVPTGATLTFAKDPSLTCTVISPRKVLFRDQEMSPSAAALTVIHEMGYDWPKVSGMEYWQYNGIRLSDLGQRDQDADLD
ncbi:MAG: GIY-YIG nuclease family protein [Sphingomicrobium sp.]